MECDWEKAKKLYDQGMNDAEIGNAIGCSRSAVNHWRLRNNLPKNKMKGVTKTRESKFNWERAKKLYDQGMNDVEIGSAIGCSSATVYFWRTKNGLPARKTRRPRSVEIDEGGFSVAEINRMTEKTKKIEVNPILGANLLAKNCAGCEYAGTLHGDRRIASSLFCDYLSKTGHRRPCPGVAGCTVKKVKKSKK
jgi:uncharacterized protein YjcR